MVILNEKTNMLEYISESGNSTRKEEVCGNIEVIDNTEEITTHKKFYLMRYYEYKTGESYEFNCDFSFLRPLKLDDLLVNNGIEVEAKYIKELSSYLQALAKKSEVTSKKINRAGFDDKLENFYTTYEINKDGSRNEVTQEPSFAKHLGPKGNKEQYDLMLKKYVNNPEMQLALVFGFAAPVSAYIKEKLDIGTLLVGLSGRTTTGKTTALQLMTSVFANPNLNQTEGFAISGKATKLSMNLILGNIWGIPVLIDDISALFNGDLQSLIFSLESGEVKGRSNVEYTQGSTAKWRGLIAMNSEKQLLEDTTLAGAGVRLLTFNDVHWTTSGVQAQKIKEVIKENYGFYGEEFVKYLYTIGQDNVVEGIKKTANDIKKKLASNVDNLSDRLITKIAVIGYTAGLVKNFLKDVIQIRTKEINKLLVIEEIKRLKYRNVSQYAKNALVQYIEESLECFATKDDKVVANIKGYIEETDEIKYIYLLDDAMEHFLDTTKIAQSKKKILNQWNADGFLIRDGDRYHVKTKKTIAGKVVRCYKISVIKSDYPEFYPVSPLDDE